MRLEELLIKIQAVLFEENEELTLETELETLDGWDSIGRLGISSLFGEVFGVWVETKELLESKTIGDIVSFVKDKLND